MTVTINAETITMAGPCGVEEVETLASFLDSRPELPVDLSAATAIHTALWQALMVFQPKIVGAPVSSLIADNLMWGLNAYLDKTGEP